MRDSLNKKIAAAAAVALMLAAVGYWAFKPQKKALPPPPAPVDEVLATVNGHQLMMSQFTVEYRRYLALHSLEGGKGRSEELNLKKIVLDKMMEQMFLEAEADRKGVEVAEAEVDQEISQLLGPGDPKEFEKSMVQRNNITMAEWRAKVKRGMRITKLIVSEIDPKSAVSEAEVKEYYKDNKESFQWPERVRALQIMSKDETSAEAIRKRLAAESGSEEKFMELAREKSISADAARGGDLGFFSRGQMPKEFEDAVFGLKPGQISDVVTTIHGFHIFKLIKREAPRQMTLDEARDRIVQIIKDDKREKEFSSWIEKLKAETKFEVRAEALLRGGS